MAVILTVLTALVLAAGMSQAAEVVQGKCIAFDPRQNKVVLEEYDTNINKQSPYGNPTGILFEGNLAKARVGIPPVPGDILRVAYYMEGDLKQVLKVMNVSKQDLRKK